MEIRINQENIKVPQNWNECNERQLSAIFNLLYNNKLKIQDVKLRITKMFLNKSVKFFKKWEQDAKKTSDTAFLDEMNDVIESCTAWIFSKTDDGNLYISGGLTNAPIGKIKLKKKEFFAPAASLSNITVLEFAYLETFFEKVRDPKQMRMSLNQLIAVLYRPSKPTTKDNISKKYEGDRRQSLEGYEATINDRAYTLQYLERHKKMLILHFYESCRKQILESLHPRMQGGSESSESEKGINGWVQIIMELSGNKFGDFKETGNTNLFIIIEYLNLEQRKISKSKS